jgi:repressor LexA
MPRNDLNEKAQAICDYIARCVEEQGYPPTVREIGERFGITSTNGVRYHLAALERAGFLRRNKKISRGIELLARAREMRVADRAAGRVPRAPLRPQPIAGIPILGRVAAGTPLLAEENVDGRLSLDEVFPAQDDLFALRIEGMSMRDRGILHGDVVVVRKQEHAREGDAVVALLGDDATVKTFRRADDAVELVPANPDFPVLRVGSEDDFRILGVVVGLVRPPGARLG